MGFRMSMTSPWATTEDTFLSETRHRVTGGETGLSFTLSVRVCLSGWLAAPPSPPRPPPPPILHKLPFEIQSDSMYRNKIARSDLVHVQVYNANSPGGLFNGGKKMKYSIPAKACGGQGGLAIHLH